MKGKFLTLILLIIVKSVFFPPINNKITATRRTLEKLHPLAHIKFILA